MKKIIQKSICFCFQGDKILVVQYKEGNRKCGYYDIPGGKIELGETSEQAAVREVEEETGLKVTKLNFKGKMKIEYEDRIYLIDIYQAQNFNGEICNNKLEDNRCEWITIDNLLQKQKLLNTTILLNPSFLSSFKEKNTKLQIHLKVKENETIQAMTYQRWEE